MPSEELGFHNWIKFLLGRQYWLKVDVILCLQRFFLFAIVTNYRKNIVEFPFSFAQAFESDVELFVEHRLVIGCKKLNLGIDSDWTY